MSSIRKTKKVRKTRHPRKRRQLKTDKTKKASLIVEDNTDIRQYLCEELGKTYHILKAENGEEALSIVKEQEVSLN